MSNPYSFRGAAGHLVDWSNLIGEVAPLVTGHNRPVTKEELAVICARKSRECDLARALRACKEAGETHEAQMLFTQIIGTHIYPKTPDQPEAVLRDLVRSVKEIEGYWTESIDNQMQRAEQVLRAESAKRKE